MRDSTRLSRRAALGLAAAAVPLAVAAPASAATTIGGSGSPAQASRGFGEGAHAKSVGTLVEPLGTGGASATPAGQRAADASAPSAAKKSSWDMAGGAGGAVVLLAGGTLALRNRGRGSWGRQPPALSGVGGVRGRRPPSEGRARRRQRLPPIGVFATATVCGAGGDRRR